MRHIIPISGKDSLATAIVQTARAPEIDYEFMFNPTGQELPDVFDWLERVEIFLGKKIVFVGRDLKQLIVEYNWFLPSRMARYCTRQSKIEPMEAYLGKSECVIYYGIRADEDRGGYDNSSSQNIHPAYPLKELGINIDMVYQINEKVNLKPPTFFWQSVYDQVANSAGENYIRETFKQWQIDALFAWRTRTNCANCFNQRKYEWVGLLEHHPEIFNEYESWEHNVSEFYFAGKDYPLSLVKQNAAIIKQRRINKLINFINSTRQGVLNFSLDDNEDDKDFIDILTVKSCGLLCGK